MSLITYPDVFQGSDEWKDQRRGMVTASIVGSLVTPSTMKVANNATSRGLTAHLVAQRITGYTEPEYISDDMLRGKEDEIRARELYAETYGYVDTIGFLVRTFAVEINGEEREIELGYSPDGLVGQDGLIEVKSRNQKLQLQTILAGEVPAEFMAQMQAGLLVSGRAWCDFLSYCGGMPMWSWRVYPDPAWHTAILQAVTALETSAIDMVTTYRASVKGLPQTVRIVYEEMVF